MSVSATIKYDPSLWEVLSKGKGIFGCDFGSQAIIRRQGVLLEKCQNQPILRNFKPKGKWNLIKCPKKYFWRLPCYERHCRS